MYTQQNQQIHGSGWQSQETLVTRLYAAIDREAGIHLVRSAEREDFHSYKKLLLSAFAIYGRLQKLGVKRGDEVILQLDGVDDYLNSFWACLLGRYVAVPLACGIKEDQLTRVYQVWRQLKRPWIVSTGPQLERLSDFWQRKNNDQARLRVFTLVMEDPGVEPIPSLLYVDGPRPSDVAFIQFSSGSTGNPKGVVLTHAEILANCGSFLARARATTGDIPLGWMPLTHDMGLIGTHLGSVVAGISPILMRTALFVRRPLLWLEKAHQHRATILSSPNFGLQYTLAAFRLRGRDFTWDLSAVRLIWNGAEPISSASSHVSNYLHG